MMESITAETEVGAEFAGPQHTFEPVRMLTFSGGPIDAPGWPAKNLHTDVEKATEAGLPAPIASGIQYEGHLVELLVQLFGQVSPNRGGGRYRAAHGAGHRPVGGSWESRL